MKKIIVLLAICIFNSCDTSSQKFVNKQKSIEKVVTEKIKSNLKSPSSLEITSILISSIYSDTCCLTERGSANDTLIMFPISSDSKYFKQERSIYDKMVSGLPKSYHLIGYSISASASGVNSYNVRLPTSYIVLAPYKTGLKLKPI